MKTWDIVIMAVNVLIAIVSAIGAHNSIRYFKKSKHITIYANTNKALGEIGDMLRALPDVLAAASIEKKGFNSENAVRDLGKELAEHYNSVMSAIPSEYSEDFRTLQKAKSFDLSKFISSLIDGTAIVEENGKKMLNRTSYDACQEKLREMQEFLKKRIALEEEKLK